MQQASKTPAAASRGRRPMAGPRTIGALMLREMATSYGRSPGGYLWEVLEPVAGIALLTAVFSLGFRAPALGISFPLFYASGMLPFLMFMHLSGRIAQSIDFSRPLLAYPAVTWLDAVLARFLLNLVTQLMVCLIVLGGILLVLPNRAVLELAWILQACGLSALLGLGVGVANCLLQGLFPVWIHGWQILMRPMFIISTIFFTFDAVPQPWRDMLWYNPLIHVIGLMRRGLYPGYDASYVAPLYVAGLGLGLLAVGMFYLSRLHRRILNR